MAIKIFDVDPDAKPRKVEDIVGKFRSGTMVNRRPLALEHWRVTSGDPELMNTIQVLFGGSKPQPWETDSEDSIEVFTISNEVSVILPGASAIRTQMVLWGRNALIRACDGETQTDDKRSPCVCPSTVAERKESAKAGTGCQPSISILFRLGEAPELGLFRFNSGSWTMAGEIGDQEAALKAIDGPALATLSLEVVEYDTKAGRHVKYTKPVLKVLGPAVTE